MATGEETDLVSLISIMLVKLHKEILHLFGFHVPILYVCSHVTSIPF